MTLLLLLLLLLLLPSSLRTMHTHLTSSLSKHVLLLLLLRLRSLVLSRRSLLQLLLLRQGCM